MTSPAMTRMGVILGTAAYMSPEQARGREVDKRADIWAFGCVLYEMLTGRAAFPGVDVSEVLAGVIKSDVAWNALPANTPSKVRALIRRCLQKDPRWRLRDIGDARLEIEEALAEPATEAAASAPAPPVGRVKLAWSVAALAIIATAIASTIAVRREAPPAATRVCSASILPPGNATIPAVIVPSARFAVSPSAFRVGDVRPLFEMRPVTNQVFMYDVSTDGQRFLVNTPLEDPASSSQTVLTLVVTWLAALRK